jgi:hypothetical protein
MKRSRLTVSWDDQLRETPSLVVLNFLVQRPCPICVVEDLESRGCCNIDGGRPDIDYVSRNFGYCRREAKSHVMRKSKLVSRLAGEGSVSRTCEQRMGKRSSRSFEDLVDNDLRLFEIGGERQQKLGLQVARS